MLLNIVKYNVFRSCVHTSNGCFSASGTDDLIYSNKYRTGSVFPKRLMIVLPSIIKILPPFSNVVLK